MVAITGDSGDNVRPGENEELYDTINEATAHTVETINAIFDSVGGRIDDSNFGTGNQFIDNGVHFELGFHHSRNDYGHEDFQFVANTRDNGTLHGDGQSIGSLIPGAEYKWNDTNNYYIHGDDLAALADHAVEYEIRYTEFYDGDLIKIQAIDAWKGEYAETAPANRLEALAQNLEVADAYRYYLNNVETVNRLIVADPESDFARDWVTVLYQATELGLNDSYNWTAQSGDTGDSTVLGASGDDHFIGGVGDDALFGYGGDDALFGYAGEDVLSGGVGADRLDGGTGNDTLDYSSSDAGIRVNLTSGTTSGGHAVGDTFA